MRRFILICIISILFSTLFSDDNIDSLQKKFISAKGIDRAYILRKIGTIHHYNANLNEALVYYQRSLEIYKELDNKEGIAQSLINIGVICENWEDYAEALVYYQRSLEINKELDNKFDIALSLNNIGYIYNKTNDQMLAKNYLERSIKIAEELESTPLLCYNYEELSETYYGLDMYKKALEYYKLYSAIKDSIFREEQRTAFTNFKVRAAVEIKEKENEILIKNNTIQELQIKKRNMFILIFIISIILITILAFVTYI